MDECKNISEPWLTPWFRKHTDPESGVVSYVLDLKPRLAVNQQSTYFTQKSLTNDGRFLIFIVSGGERRYNRTAAVLDIATGKACALEVPANDLFRHQTGAIPYLDLDSDRLYCVNFHGAFYRDLRGDPREPIQLCPLPENITRLKPMHHLYCHLTLTKKRDKCFLDTRLNDHFIQGTLDFRTGEFEKWGETDFFLDHGQLNPANDRMALGAWEVMYVDNAGVTHRIHDVKGVYPRLWLLEPGNYRMIAPARNFATHEHWTEDGKGFYYPSSWSIQYYDLATDTHSLLMNAPASHACMDGTNRFITYDIPYDTNNYSSGCPFRVGFYSRATAKSVWIHSFIREAPERPCRLHSHPHPHFVLGGRCIISTIRTPEGFMETALTPVDQLIERTK